MRYYYTCPIKALYMQEHFGVKLMPEELFETVSNVFGSYEEGNDFHIKFNPHFDKVYVAPESEEIMKRKEGDVVGWLEKTNYYGWVDAYGDVETAGDRVIGDINRKEENWITIMRSGKLFFQAEVESE